MKLHDVAIILVETTHDGNVGATARAMGNMGFSDLRLVNPRQAPGAEAYARASGADWILDKATHHASLADAVADRRLVIGTTARRRESAWQVFSPKEIASQAALVYADHAAAIVFGRESSGLSNRELDLCDSLVSIPVDQAFSSLNVASAVMVICYELRVALEAGTKPVAKTSADNLPATAAARENFFDHLQETLSALSFVKVSEPEKLMRKIRHLYMKAAPSTEEVSILRGILASITESIDKKKD